jgi:hypothetical protein
MDFNEIIAFTGGINTDDTPQGVPKGDYRDFSYCRLGYNSGNAYAVETSDGTLVIPNPSIEIQDQIIGATPWLKENAIVYFVFKADLNHQIWVYYIDTQLHEEVLTSTELNFSRDWPIFHANVVDDILKWTDGRWDNQMYDADGNRLFNPPYQINLRKALDGDYTVITLQTIDAIKWPIDPPYVYYVTDATRNDNKLRNKLFKFIVQPIYENGEIGVWSMYSNLNLPVQSELISGTNWVYLNNDNCIRIEFNTGPSIIRKFNLAVQQFDIESFGTTPPFGVFLQLDKDEDGIADNVTHIVNFYGGVTTSAAVDVFKNYDRLPVVADCQEYLPTSQLTYVNFREGYDKPTEPPFVLDVQMEYQTQEIDWTVSAGFFEMQGVSPNGVPLLWQVTGGFNASYTYYISYQFDLPFATVINFRVTGGTVDFMGQQIVDQINDHFNEVVAALDPSDSNIIIPVGAGFEASYDLVTTTALNQTLSRPSLKTGATHRFGIVYGDRAYRDGTVYTNDSMNLFVPWFYDIDRTSFTNDQNPFLVNARITIDHVPPVWADRYWIVATPTDEILSFGHYVTNIKNLNPVQPDLLSSISIDTNTRNRYKIEIDNYYQNQNIGALVRHEIRIGDKIRFIRRNKLNDFEYIPYLELDVVDYNPTGGTDQRQVVYTNLFDTSLIEPNITTSNGQLFGQLIEIYTPRPSVDTTGSIFVSTWKDVTQSLSIAYPHTENRSHNVPPLYLDNFQQIQGFTQTSTPTPDILIVAFGDFTSTIGNTYVLQIQPIGLPSYQISSTVTNGRYLPDTNQTVLTIPGVPTTTVALVTFISASGPFPTQAQIVDALISNRPAEFSIPYGDVYVRLRNYLDGTPGSISNIFVEDPHYSDYWSSNVHSDGRTRVEDPNARMTHRQATAIHSDSFIVGTQINGLSSFSLLNDNIEDMNPSFGPVVRAYMSGREGKTLKCLQPKKENSIYIQFYPNEVGSDSTVRVSNRTFASWFDYKSLVGCSDAGASAILPDGTTMYFDNNAGLFMYSGGNGQIVVSEIDPGSGKDYKFRTKTKQLASAYNASSNPLVRTYVNESVGEVGFAFRFDVPFTGEAFGLYNPPFDLRQSWVIKDTVTDYSYLFGQYMIIVHQNGAIYSGTVNSISTAPIGPPYTIFSLDTGGPAAAEYDVPAYWYTTSNLTYDHVVFDYVNMRWRSTYDYNFQQFCNLGQTLVGWGANNQLYLHNQYGNWEFHGQPFIQKVSFVSNENPLALKRYQDITLISDEIFSIEAFSEPNRSYPLGMKTSMPASIINTYEGYGSVYYRKNLYDPRFFGAGTSTISNYDPPTTPVDGWLVPGDQSFLNNQNITIIQTDGSIFSGRVTSAAYSILDDETLIRLFNQGPGTIGVTGFFYNSDRAMLNGEDMRANALTHNLYFDPSLADQSSILFSVGIKGVLS